MLRSIAFGFAIAALLQFGAYTATSASGLRFAHTFASSSLECQAAALSQLISDGYRLIAR